MDPLSIAASVIAIATVAGQVGKAFAELRKDCSELPGRLHALSNEVADIEFVLHQVAAVLKERNCLSEDDKASIPTLLIQAKAKLTELKSVLDQLAGSCARKRVLLRASVWRKWYPKLQALQVDIRTIKCSLNVLLGASNSRDLLRVRLDLETLSRTTSHESGDQTDFRIQVSEELAQHHAALSESVDQSVQRVDQRISKIEELLMTQAIGIDKSQFLGTMPEPQSTAVAIRQRPSRAATDSSFEKMGLTSQAISVRVKKSIGPVCRPDCACACHSGHNAKSSGYWDGIIGRLFLGYSGLPLLSAGCDLPTCRKPQTPSVSAEYWFPLGFCWSQIVRLELSYQSHIGPQFGLTTLRRVPDSAQCVKFALEGDIDGLQALFRHGMASPKDWALYGQKYETCRFLLNAGADTDYRPIAVTDDSPADKACDVLLRGNLSASVVEILRYIARDSEFIESQNFSAIHKIVLQLSMRDLETEILRDTTAVDARDAMGRTALEWAAARGDDRAVITLLSFGAQPDSMDKKLNTPLTLASNQGHTLCVRLLLEAGALPDPVLPPGVKFGSPLNCAARNANDPLLIKTLLDFDADVEACGVDGVTPLLHAARGKPVSFAKLLLDYGANINAMARDGRTPLTTTIIYNNHEVLRLLLGRWFEYTECPRLKGPHLLDLVVEHADVETMRILTSADHLQFRRDDKYVLERFATQINKRLDLSNEMVSAFEDLLDAMREFPKSSRDPESHGESRIVDPTGETESCEEDLDSCDEFEDAHESLALVSDDLSSLTTHRPKLVPNDSSTG
ncbi:hypothetical protein ACLMJK_002014 [Lecanora helva]